MGGGLRTEGRNRFSLKEFFGRAVEKKSGCQDEGKVCLKTWKTPTQTTPREEELS